MSLNVTWGQRKRMADGKVSLPYKRFLGYEKGEDGLPQIVEAEAKTVRLIYKMFLEGKTPSGIASYLTNKGVPTPSGKQKWQHSTVKSILTNEKYTGDCLMQKSFVNDNGRQIINRGQRAKYLIENNHPAIIDRKDWEAAQQIRESRRKKAYPLRSMLRCPFCGASLTRVVHERQWVSWICATYLQRGKAMCPGMRIADGVLQEIVKDTPVTEPVVVEGVIYGKGRKKRSQEDFRLIPAAQYGGFKHNRE